MQTAHGHIVFPVVPTMPIRSPAAPQLLVLIAGMVIIVGSIARLWDVDRMVVWHDEVFTMVRAFGFDGGRVGARVFSGGDLTPDDLLLYQRPSPALGWDDTLASLRTHPEHSPLFYLAARLAAPAFQSPLTAVRGISAVLALLLIPAVFWLAWELFRSSTTAWIASALVACSPMHLLYAQEARQYALWTVLSAAASAALLLALREGRSRDWAIYGILITLGLYTHLLFALVLAVHAAYLVFSLYRDRPRAMSHVRGWAAAVAIALVLFSPWIGVVIARAHRVEAVTAWMERPVPVQRLFEAWGTNLVRVFADFPSAGPLLLAGLLPLSCVLWQFCVRAPGAARMFVCLLFLTFAAAVLVPDLTQGGSRSLHPRYVLPAFLALGLAAAYVLAAGWNSSSRGRRIAALFALVLVLGAGVSSDWLILRADTWWNKNFSAQNREVAAVVNGTEGPLVVVTDSGVGLGEVISLAHDLDERVIIRGEPRGGEVVPTTGFSDIFLVTPSAELRADLAADYDLVPVLETWQWYRAVPKAARAGP